jgi:hypothetical protein
MNRSPTYDWERFWVARTGTLDLSDSGFLSDPTSDLVKDNPARPATLAELSKFRVLALLGEPGIGKSTALTAEVTRADPNNQNTVSIHVDLRAYSSEVLMHKRIFESSEFLTWKAGTSHLLLHLDSLDEALLRVDTIANLLASELRNYPVERMSVRIACRTAVWPAATLEPALIELWGNESVGVFELAPLRRRDVMGAANSQGIDAEQFVEELYRANAVPFSIKPLTLNLLLSHFKRDGRLPRSASELYTKGCAALCEESSASRRDANRLGRLAPAQRLRVASRLAAATMLANRYAIWSGAESGDVPEEDITVSLVAGAHEAGDFAAFETTDADVREVLDTGLFTSRGGARMGWAHQSYAEFLAALYLEKKEVSSRNILKILIHPAGGLVPQLAAVASWVASLNREVRDTLIATEPLVLLRGDLVTWGDEDRAALTASLLEAFERNGAHDFFPGILNAYERLAHPSLAAQLRPYIGDASKNVITRRAAVMMAEACSLKELEPELLYLALDTSADASLRARAVAALRKCGDVSSIGKLMPLAKGELGPDPQDDLKGYALQILWPRHLSASELFANITHSNEGYVGAYSVFLRYELPESIGVADFPTALNWAKHFIARVGLNGDYDRKSLADAIFVKSWPHLDQQPIAESLVDYVFTCFYQAGELFRGTGRHREEFQAQLTAEHARRRAFLLTVSNRVIAKIDLFGLVRAGILQHDDFAWLLGVSPGGDQFCTQLNANTVCSMIELIFQMENSAQFELLYDAAARWPLLWEHYRGLLEGIPLDSTDAKQARETHLLMERYKRDKPPTVTPPPAERVAALLDQFETGDAEAWWRLNRELTLTPTSTHYGSDFDYVISKMPGWVSADDATKARLIRAAGSYLQSGHTAVTEWIGTSSFNRRDLAAFRAFILLRQEEDAVYRLIKPEVWAKWAAAIACLPKEAGSEGWLLEVAIISDALSLAPTEFVAAIRKRMQLERSNVLSSVAKADEISGASFIYLRELECCLNNQAFKEGLFEELCDDFNTPDQLRTLFDLLLTVRFAPAEEVALMVMERHDEHERSKVMVAASALVRFSAIYAWPTIWKAVTSDAEFGRELFLHIATYHRFQESLFAPLTEEQLAELYVMLETLFPRPVKPKHPSGQAHWVGPQESLDLIRDQIPRLIIAKGTPAAVDAMRSVASRLPQCDWLRFQVVDAEQVMRIVTWRPLSPAELFKLTTSRKAVLIQTAEDLLDLLSDSLREYETQLHGEQNPVRGLWDRQAGGSTFRPIEEDSISDDVSRFLRRNLVDSGMVANREVEVVRVPGASIGKRTDIRVDALRRSEVGLAQEPLTAVIETKGCWNRELFFALEHQLHREYLVRLRAPVGIYLVAWFDKGKWDPNDHRRRETPNCTIEEAQARLDDQAAAIPSGYLVRAIVLDCHAP